MFDLLFFFAWYQGTCGKSGLICHNGGACVDDRHCQCLHGWTGVTCSGRM